MPQHQKSFYEVFTSKDKVFLYLDIEYKFRFNTGKRHNLAMRAIRRIIKQEIFSLIKERYPTYVLEASKFEHLNDTGLYYELDATSDYKFSRHIIFKPPFNIVFDSTND